MRVAVVGAGPAGLLMGSALASRGHEVVAVERDSGPPRQGVWARRGVMQFHHAHGFRPQVGQVLQEEWPAAFAAWTALGAEPITFDVPGVGPVPGGHRSRRDTFERALRATSDGVAGVAVRQGHVDGVVSRGGRVRGIVVDGRPLDADLVVDASGRSGRAADDVRAPSRVGGPCGMAYVDRQYRLRDGADPGPMANPLFWRADFDGYQAIVFLHERGHFSVVLVADGRCGPEGAASRGRVRRCVFGHPRAGRVDRPGARTTGDPGAPRWRAPQRLPRAAGDRRRIRAARPGERRGCGGDHHPDGRSWPCHGLPPVLPVAGSPGRRGRSGAGGGAVRRLVRGQHAAVGP
ncbi:FAD-dependent oxidoreductase [Geodermatophilus sp. CPCC 205761]|uniref:FAD-dependent oxidoreductase n=1 Tax=Geodermatophilus sp. CPCC 205761 TaxID=2936597 RepID=UPI003F52DA0D